jgi:hypothetical protein
MKIIHIAGVLQTGVYDTFICIVSNCSELNVIAFRLTKFFEFWKLIFHLQEMP